MRVLNVWLLLYIPFPGLYNKTYIQSVVFFQLHYIYIYIYICIYSNEHKDRNDVKKKSKCEITFYFNAS